jgi:hypothetical protein
MTPSPVPDTRPVKLIQSTVFVAVHVHAEGAITCIVPVPPFVGRVALVVSIAISHPAAGWDTRNAVLATVIAAVLGSDKRFAATPNVTVPVPVPLGPAVTKIQLAVLSATQGQDGVVVTVNVPEPPFTATVCCAGVTVYKQVDAS